MSLHISFDAFQKMVDKECLKQTGMSLGDVPTVFCEDFWPVDLTQDVPVHDAKEAADNCIKAVIDTLGG